MAIQRLQKIYDGANLTGTHAGVMYLRAEFGGVITGLNLYADAPVSQDSIFNLAKNGVNLFAAGSEPKILSGNNLVSVNALNFAVAKGDLLTLNCTNVSVQSPLVLFLDIDDGVAPPSPVLVGDVTGNVGANVISQIQKRDVHITPPSSGVNDDFNASDFDYTKWVKHTTSGDTSFTAIQGNGNLSFSLNNPASSYQPLMLDTVNAFDFTNKTIALDMISRGTAYGVWVARLYIGIFNANSRDNDLGFYFDNQETGSWGIFGQYGGYNVPDEDGKSNTITDKIRLFHDTVSGNIQFFVFNISTGQWTMVKQFVAPSWITNAKFGFRLKLANRQSQQTPFIVDNLISNIAPPTIGNKSMLWWNETANRYEVIELAALKAALASLP